MGYAKDSTAITTKISGWFIPKEGAFPKGLVTVTLEGHKKNVDSFLDYLTKKYDVVVRKGEKSE